MVHKRKKVDPEERRLRAAAFREQRRLEEELQELQEQFASAAKPATAKLAEVPAKAAAAAAKAKAEAEAAAGPVYEEDLPYWAQEEEDYHWQDKRW